MSTLLAWTRRVALLALALAAAQRLIRRASASGGQSGPEGTLPPIVGDTWPPVPTNPDRTA